MNGFSVDAGLCPRHRRGSALLIVLGMLAFMVISGVAFSVYMRATRLPSSFTRRTVSTRQLAKAALAEAIDQIDRAVANDPHPGVRNGYRQYYTSTKTTVNAAGDTVNVFDPDRIDNFWAGRVLIGRGGSTDNLNIGSGVSVGGNTYYPEFADPEETVPVLTLEALAYLPPPLVNEARYYGQRTPTAGWQTFDFDAGRYAYIAVDVSDYFDVNRILPDRARLSEPATRVTLGHLFENAAHDAAPDIGGWKTFMNSFRSASADGEFTFDGTHVPLVSLADFNLALGSQSFGGMKSPFVQYVENGGNNFYGANPGSEQFDKYGEMTFVTDSLMATRPQSEMKTEGGDAILDLAGNQIFTEAFLGSAQENRPLLTVGQQLNSGIGRRLVQTRVPYVTMFALNDYLDSDRIPITLGMPSVERVPMICGIKPQLGSGGRFVVKTDCTRVPDVTTTITPTGTYPAQRHIKRTVSWLVDAASLAAMFQGGLLQTLVVYPFRNHEQEDESSWFQLDGKVQIFLSTDEMKLRTGNRSDFLHWGASGSANDGGTVGLQPNKAVINLPLTAQAIPLTTVPVNSQKAALLGNECVKEVRFDLMQFAANVASALQVPNGDLITIAYEWDETQQSSGSPWQTTGGVNHDSITVPDVSYATATPDPNSVYFSALKADGTVDPDIASLTAANVAGFQKTLYLNMAVTLRVISRNAGVLGASPGNLKTVDMVPATIFDDNDVNQINNDNFGATLYQNISGEPTPLMKFDTGASFQLKFDSATRDAPISLTPSAVIVNDPRYNHAPENWIEPLNFSAQGWYDVAKASAESNDGDIFMATSDQEYLQSVYEFAFLPRASNLEQYGDSIRGNLPGYPVAANSWARLAPANTTAVDGGLMWRTYDIFGRYDTNRGGDDFEGLGLEYEGNGLRVNPYSNSENVLMAAFANTPHDWRVASNSEDENPAGASGMDNVATFNKQHAWNEYSSGAKITWEGIQSVADEFSVRMKNAFSTQNDSGIKSKDEVYADVLDDAFRTFFGNATGANAEKYLCGIDLSADSKNSPVYSVDKKFLYGYWKSCFAARQQLYLVFFRAEPQALGGGVAGVTPPQLGARGVALVWRDPYDPLERKSANGSVTRYYPTPDDAVGGNSVYFPHKTRVLFYKQFE